MLTHFYVFNLTFPQSPPAARARRAERLSSRWAALRSMAARVERLKVCLLYTSDAADES